MKIQTSRLGLILGVCAAVASASLVEAQVKKGKSRALETKYLMRGIIKVHCTQLKEGLDKAPADDKAWDQLAMNAALLNEASYTLMDDGRCPDGVWAEAVTKKLRQGSADAYQAILAKDLAAAKKAFGELASSCKTCHDKHKEK